MDRFEKELKMWGELKERRMDVPAALEPPKVGFEDINLLNQRCALYMLELAHIIVLSTTQVRCEGSTQLRNPIETLAHLLAAGTLDSMPMRQFEQLLDASIDLAELWKGKDCDTSAALAQQAFMRTIEGEPKLYETAKLRAQERAFDSGKQLSRESIMEVVMSDGKMFQYVHAKAWTRLVNCGKKITGLYAKHYDRVS